MSFSTASLGQSAMWLAIHYAVCGCSKVDRTATLCRNLTLDLINVFCCEKISWRFCFSCNIHWVMNRCSIQECRTIYTITKHTVFAMFYIPKRKLVQQAFFWEIGCISNSLQRLILVIRRVVRGQGHPAFTAQPRNCSSTPYFPCQTYQSTYNRGWETRQQVETWLQARQSLILVPVNWNSLSVSGT